MIAIEWVSQYRRGIIAIRVNLDPGIDYLKCVYSLTTKVFRLWLNWQTKVKLEWHEGRHGRNGGYPHQAPAILTQKEDYQSEAILYRNSDRWTGYLGQSSQDDFKLRYCDEYIPANVLVKLERCNEGQFTSPRRRKRHAGGNHEPARETLTVTLEQPRCILDTASKDDW